MPEYSPTPEQALILEHRIEQHGRVLAGPGTGKSATLVALIGKLIVGEVPPRVRLLTFTRAATGELAKTVSAHPAAAVARPSTIHSFAISILLQNAGASGLIEPLRIVDRWEDKFVVLPMLAKLTHVKTKRIKELIKEMAANFESLSADTDPSIEPQLRGRFLGAWNEHRRVFGYTLLAELPFALHGLLASHDEIRGIDFNLLVVDEYQDLNACDLGILKMLADRNTSILGAGDDDQSIYMFRKAAPEGIRRFPQDYLGCSDYQLSVTQRCAHRIVTWANHVISGDTGRIVGRPLLRALSEAPPGDVGFLAFPDQLSEPKGIADLVDHLVHDEHLRPSDILILLRSDNNDSFSGPIRNELESRDIACSDPEVVYRILADKPNRYFIEMLRLLVNPNDSLAWAGLLRLTPGLGPTTQNAIYERAVQHNMGFGETLLAMRAEGFVGISGVRRTTIQSLIDGVIHWLEVHSLPEEPPEEGWGHWIVDAATDLSMAPTEEFRTLLLDVDTVAEIGQDFDRYLGQLGPTAADKATADSDGVRIMTMQSAKGLTVRAAIVTAVEDDIIPRPKCDIREERRLLYVAMTRAREFLFCTWTQNRIGPTARAGRTHIGPRTYSRFLQGGPVHSEDGVAYIRRRWQS